MPHRHFLLEEEFKGERHAARHFSEEQRLSAGVQHCARGASVRNASGGPHGLDLDALAPSHIAKGRHLAILFCQVLLRRLMALQQTAARGVSWARWRSGG